MIKNGVTEGMSKEASADDKSYGDAIASAARCISGGRKAVAGAMEAVSSIKVPGGPETPVDEGSTSK